MASYTAEHFADEERMMCECNYADYDRDKANHEKLVNLVLGYKGQFEGTDPGVEAAAMNFITTWLTGHVPGTDRNYPRGHAPVPRAQAGRRLAGRAAGLRIPAGRVCGGGNPCGISGFRRSPLPAAASRSRLVGDGRHGREPALQ